LADKWLIWLGSDVLGCTWDDFELKRGMQKGDLGDGGTLFWYYQKDCSLHLPFFVFPVLRQARGRIKSGFLSLSYFCISISVPQLSYRFLWHANRGNRVKARKAGKCLHVRWGLCYSMNWVRGLKSSLSNIYIKGLPWMLQIYILITCYYNLSSLWLALLALPFFSTSVSNDLIWFDFMSLIKSKSNHDYLIIIMICITWCIIIIYIFIFFINKNLYNKESEYWKLNPWFVANSLKIRGRSAYV